MVIDASVKGHEMLTPELVRLTINDAVLTVRFTRQTVAPPPLVVMLEPLGNTAPAAVPDGLPLTEHTLTLGHDCPAMAEWVSKQLRAVAVPAMIELWSAANRLNGEFEYVAFDDVRDLAVHRDTGLRRGTLPRHQHYLTGTVQADPEARTATGPLPTPSIVVDPVPGAVA